MSPIEIYKKQREEWESFEAEKHYQWYKMNEQLDNILHAFGNNTDFLPESELKRREDSLKQWAEEWGANGIKEKELKQAQKAERELQMKQIQNILQKIKNARKEDNEEQVQ